MAPSSLPEVAILGSGWAGSAAALWAHRLGLGICPWISGEAQVGGCLHQAHNPFWDRLGVASPAPTGPQLALALKAQLDVLGLAPSLGLAQGLRLGPPDAPVGLLLNDQPEALWARHLVLAPGLRPRPWELPGAEALEGRFWGRSASLGVAKASGRVAAVVGGGDGAAEAAAMLARVCPEVHWLLRGPAPRARQTLVDAALACPNLRLHREVRVSALNPDGLQGLRLTLEGTESLPEGLLSVGWLVVKLGFAPNTAWLGSQLALDAEGYAQTDAWGRSLSHPRVFVVGDAASPFQASLAAAEGQAATALKAIQAWRQGLALPDPPSPTAPSA